MSGVLNVAETARTVRSRKCSARQAVQSAINAIRDREGRLKTFISVSPDAALKRADEIDAAIAHGRDPGPLAGVPVALKDNICNRHAATTCASNILRDFVPPYDAHVVERLTAAGAIILAKTNMDEFAMGSSTENSGFFKTRNPWNENCVPGGSSGGSTAAVAARMIPAAFGSDTGGSIRQPAALCGVTGLKPTYGRVSRYGLVAFGSSLDQIGPITVDARDAALLLAVIAGRDPRDSTSVAEPVPDYVAALDKPIHGLKIGIAAEYFGQGLDPQVETAVRAALDLFRARGAEVREITLPHMKYAVACYYVVATAEASSNLARYDGVHYGHRTPVPSDLIDLYARSRHEGFGAEVKRRIMLGTYVLSSGYYDAYYLKALKVRTLIRRDFERAFESVDVIASPVTPTTAFPIGEKSDDPLAMYLADIYTISANLAGVPAISIPCGFDAKRLPIGLQLTGPWFREDRILNLAHQFQSATDHHTHRPPLAAA
ncbi:MAG: Asp-tRNA(Asn)/Glu-tRNA(Gln) amidotransferase subunit GatA [Phycisphaerales bacterium]|nr:Asp-tRNA(Asn)/Glu-tRNA(Gln) amidotransferase subunit GatA [Phycisphaerales bacterium]